MQYGYVERGGAQTLLDVIEVVHARAYSTPELKNLLLLVDVTPYHLTISLCDYL